MIGTRFEDEWRKRFQEFAEDRDDDAGIAGWTETGLAARLRRFSGLTQPPARREVWLDAGCGAGTYTRMLAEGGATVVGVDYSHLAAIKARARSGPVIRFVTADVRRLPFRATSFDGVLCLGVAQALSDPAPAVAELSTMVRPGGSLFIDALNGWCVVHAVAALRRRLSRRAVHLRYDTPWAIRRLVAAAGLTDVELHWMPILPRRWHRFQRWIEAPAVQFIFRYVPFAGLLACHAFIVHGKRPMQNYAECAPEGAA